MNESLEVWWTQELRAALVRWILHEAQLPEVLPKDLATPEMVALTMRNRRRTAERALQGLRTLLESGKIRTLDCEVMDAVARLKRNPLPDESLGVYGEFTEARAIGGRKELL